jgi:RNA polymerase sigma factor (sigma-70 family)
MDELDGAELRKAAIIGGDTARDAFRRLWEGFYRRFSVFAVSYRGLPSAERHDAVADALIAVFGALASYDPGRPLGPWAYRIAANRFSDAVRLAARVSTLSLEPVAEGQWAGEASRGIPEAETRASGDHATDVVVKDLVDRCRYAIAVLPESDRRIAILRFYESMSASDIGKVLGMPAATVRWRVSVIRAGIREDVGEDAP